MTLQDLAKYIVEEVKTATNGATDLSEKLAMLDDIPLMSEAVPPARLNSGPVTKVVGKSFDDVVLAPGTFTSSSLLTHPTYTVVRVRTERFRFPPNFTQNLFLFTIFHREGRHRRILRAVVRALQEAGAAVGAGRRSFRGGAERRHRQNGRHCERAQDGLRHELPDHHGILRV